MFKKCPYCNQNIITINIKAIPIYNEFGVEWKGVTYTCPNLKCNSILSVGIDPIALKNDTVNEVINRLKQV